MNLTRIESLAGRPLTEAEIAMATARQDNALAESISVNRVKIGMVMRPEFVMWCAASGLRAAIQDAASTIGHPLRSIALSLLDFLQGGAAEAIDFSLAGNVQMLNAWVAAGAVTIEQRAQLIALATSPDPISVDAISEVLNA
jgi:hypothetical protein